MKMDISGAAQAGILTFLTGMIGWLFYKRAGNSVKTQNDAANRESVFQENLQTRLEAALKRADDLELRLRDARDGKAILERKLLEADRNMVRMLDEVERLSVERREELERWVHNSRLAGLDEPPPLPPPRPRKRPT